MARLTAIACGFLLVFGALMTPTVATAADRTDDAAWFQVAEGVFEYTSQDGTLHRRLEDLPGVEWGIQRREVQLEEMLAATTSLTEADAAWISFLAADLKRLMELRQAVAVEAAGSEDEKALTGCLRTLNSPWVDASAPGCIWGGEYFCARARAQFSWPGCEGSGYVHALARLPSGTVWESEDTGSGSQFSLDVIEGGGISPYGWCSYAYATVSWPTGVLIEEAEYPANCTNSW